MDNIKRIKEWMTVRRLSYARAARLCGCSKAQMHKIVTGQCPVTARTARGIAQAMGIKAWWKLVQEGE